MMSAKTGIIIVALLASLGIFLAGWYSGLYAHGVITAATSEKVEHATEELQSQLQAEILKLRRSLDSAQVDSAFVDTLPDDQACTYLGLLSDRVMDEMASFWSRLPQRLEAMSEDETRLFEAVRQDYDQLSIRGWVFFREVHMRCEQRRAPILYFYTPGCKECIEQGEQLDELRNALGTDDLVAFVVDGNADQPVIRNIRSFYEITQVPALVVGDTAIQGRVVSADELQVLLDA